MQSIIFVIYIFHSAVGKRGTFREGDIQVALKKQTEKNQLSQTCLYNRMTNEDSLDGGGILRPSSQCRSLQSL